MLYISDTIFLIPPDIPELEGCEDMIRETLSNPERVLEGDGGALMAVRKGIPSDYQMYQNVAKLPHNW
jgi:hypothetical protein